MASADPAVEAPDAIGGGVVIKGEPLSNRSSSAEKKESRESDRRRRRRKRTKRKKPSSAASDAREVRKGGGSDGGTEDGSSEPQPQDIVCIIRGRGHRCMSDALLGDPPLQEPITRDHILQDPSTQSNLLQDPPIRDSQPHPNLEDMQTHEPLDADIPSHTSGPASSRGSCSSKRKRGKAKGIPRPSNEADRLLIRITDGRAVGGNRNKFTTKIGVWVKDQSDFPFWQREFDSFPRSKWDDMARVAREYFNIAYEGNLADFLKANSRKVWNDARSALYRHDYEPYPHNEAIQRVPRDMDYDSWTKVCEDVFSQPWWKATSEINTDNRTHQMVVHVSGRTSFTQRTEDLRTQLGREPKRVELWDRCHVRADGTSANAHTQEVTSQMNEMIEQARQTSGIVDEDVIFREVLGPESRGRVRGQGSGISRKDYFSSQHPSHTEMQRQVDTLQLEHGQLKSAHEQLKSAHEQLQSAHEQLISRCEGMVDENHSLKQVVYELQKKFNEISQIFHRDSSASMSSQMPYQQSSSQMLQGGGYCPPASLRPPHPPSGDNLDPPTT